MGTKLPFLEYPFHVKFEALEARSPFQDPLYLIQFYLILIWAAIQRSFQQRISTPEIAHI